VIVALAKEKGVEHHPGYGFLSENPALAVLAKKRESLCWPPRSSRIANIKPVARRWPLRGVPCFPELENLSSRRRKRRNSARNWLSSSLKAAMVAGAAACVSVMIRATRCHARKKRGGGALAFGDLPFLWKVSASRAYLESRFFRRPYAPAPSLRTDCSVQPATRKCRSRSAANLPRVFAASSRCGRPACTQSELSQCRHRRVLYDVGSQSGIHRVNPRFSRAYRHEWHRHDWAFKILVARAQSSRTGSLPNRKISVNARSPVP